MVSSVKRYASSISAEDIKPFRSLKDWSKWYSNDMSQFLMFIVNNNHIDAYRNNYEIGFVQGKENYCVDNGDIIFSPDMKHYTTEVSNARSKYWFDNRRIKYEPADCWYLVYRDLQTQVIQRYKKVMIETKDEILRDNAECPCCLEKLEGMLFKCDNNHQVCLKCFDNLHHTSYTLRKCPVCRSIYTIDEVKRLHDAKGKKEIVLQEIHFTGSKVEREYKLCGLFKTAFNGDNSDLIGSLISAGLFYYVMETHLPLLEDKGNYSIFNLDWDMVKTQSWNDFFIYLKTDKLKETIYSKGKGLSASYNYDETTFLRHLTLKYGNDAMNVLTEASKDRSGNAKDKLKFKMYYEYVYLEQPFEDIIKKFKKIIEKVFCKDTHYRKTWDLIESEITE